VVFGFWTFGVVGVFEGRSDGEDDDCMEGVNSQDSSEAC